ncbi:uncharacterized protein LOC102804266 [Saccoglossus kowalevskii]|uniref:Suppressor of cytokine signaling 6-like n=1 Tax=Saccoglossus kowalevskii TaxID=10224 RepID=A0ABM0LV14_SACKO|nr:PREDICTED: suppressor of cytokine signaling 6-like [Saccoglossus kowalevskii]
MKKFSARGLKITFHRRNHETGLSNDESGRSLSSIEVAEPDRPKTTMNGEKGKESFMQTVKKRFRTHKKSRGRRGSATSSEDAFPTTIQSSPKQGNNISSSGLDYYNRPPRPRPSVYSSMRDRNRRFTGPLRAFNSEEALDKFEVHVEVHTEGKNDIGNGGGVTGTKGEVTSPIEENKPIPNGDHVSDLYENMNVDHNTVRPSNAPQTKHLAPVIDYSPVHITPKDTTAGDQCRNCTGKDTVSRKGPPIPKRPPKSGKTFKAVTMQKYSQAYIDKAYDTYEVEQKDMPTPVYDLVNDQPHNSLTRELNKLSKRPWYWGPLTRNEAEEKLSNMPDGSFLVRDSSDDRYLLSLSFRSNGKTLHTRIEHFNGLFSFYPQQESEGYYSIVDLIEHSMNDSRAGVFCYSRERLPGVRSYPVRLTNPVSRFTKVPSLQYLCRFVIREFIRRDHIQRLPLPRRIKGYLEENHF